MGLRKGTRLTDSPEFERVYKKGTAHRGKLFSVHVFPGGSGDARLGLSVSKRVGNAVRRNSVKRRLREVFRSRLPYIEGDKDFVISARPAAANASYDDLAEEFERALGKLNGSEERAS